MNTYTFEKRDFTQIDQDVAEFNKLPREGIIANFNHRIDLDYISNSDEIENINSDKTLLNILHNSNLKVLRSVPSLLVNDSGKQSGVLTDKIINMSGMDGEDKEGIYKNILK